MLDHISDRISGHAIPIEPIAEGGLERRSDDEKPRKHENPKR